MKNNKDIEAKQLGNSAKGPEGKTSAASHTPTPWHQNINVSYPIYAGEAPNHEIVAYVDSKNPRAEGNLKLIVCAVNAHDELVMIARTYRASLGTTDGQIDIRNHVDAILAKAEGGA